MGREREILVGRARRERESGGEMCRERDSVVERWVGRVWWREMGREKESVVDRDG